jgi:hypothetical protein
MNKKTQSQNISKPIEFLSQNDSNMIKSKIVNDDDEDSEKDKSTTRLYGVNACYSLHKKTITI